MISYFYDKDKISAYYIYLISCFRKLFGWDTKIDVLVISVTKDNLSTCL
jgi:hypothetical protein